MSSDVLIYSRRKDVPAPLHRVGEDRPLRHPGGLVSIGELQPGAIQFMRDWLQIHRNPWSGLTAKEQHIIEQKLKPEEGDKSVQDCFKRIVTEQGDVRENVIAIKNLIDVAGGHDGETSIPHPRTLEPRDVPQTTTVGAV